MPVSAPAAHDSARRVAPAPDVGPGPTGGPGGRSVPARCPRCGYDLTGALKQWPDDACPLEGRCTECGLVFEWGDVLAPEQRESAWVLETDRPRRSLPRRVLGTFVRSWRPRRFWSRLSMAQPARPRALAAYLLMMLIGPAAILYVGGQSVVALLVHRIVVAEVRAMDARYGAPIGRGPTVIGVSAAGAVWAAIVRPLDTTPPVWIPTARSPTPYPAPARLHAVLISELGGRRSIMTRMVLLEVRRVLVSPASLAWAAGLVLLPATMVLLPVTLRRHRVRPYHLWRILVLGSWIFWVPLVVAFAGAMVHACGLGGDLARSIIRAAPLAGAGVLVTWWATALGRYLEIERPWFVVSVLLVVCVLLELAAALTIVPGGNAWVRDLVAFGEAYGR